MATARPKDSDYGTVQSLVEGDLIALDSNGYEIIWNGYGDEQELTLKDVKHIKRKSKRFFDECWIRIPEEWEKVLRIEGYLDSDIDLDRIDNFFNMEPEKFNTMFTKASNGVRRIVIDKAVEKIYKSELDSRRIINIIQKESKVDLNFLCEEMRLKEEKEQSESDKK